VTWFGSRDEAAARYLRISGLADPLTADAPAVDAGLREEHGRWRLAVDPGAFAVGAPDMAQLLARSQVPVALARGEHDAMNTGGQLARLGFPRSRSRAWATTHTSRALTCLSPSWTPIDDTRQPGQRPA
jgi:hypothetical protein